MSIKKLVNDVELYGALMEHLDVMIAKEQRSLESLTDTTLIFRSQGAISALRKLKLLREAVNVKHS